MDLLTQKIFEAIENKVTKKTFFTVIGSFLLINFYINNGVIIDIIKNTWAAILIISTITFTIHMLFKHSKKTGIKDHINRDFQDKKYAIANTDFTIEIQTNLSRCKYDLLPIRKIVFANKTQNIINECKGFIDFYCENLCIERLDFDIKTVMPHKFFLVSSIENSDILSYWTQAILHIESFNNVNSDEIIYGKRMIHIPDLNYYLAGNHDLRWIKEKIRKLHNIIKFYYKRKLYIFRAKSKDDVMALIKDFISKWFFRIIFLITALLTLIVIAFLGCILFRDIVDFIKINIQLFTKLFA